MTIWQLSWGRSEDYMLAFSGMPSKTTQDGMRLFLTEEKARACEREIKAAGALLKKDVWVSLFKAEVEE